MLNTVASLLFFTLPGDVICSREESHASSSKVLLLRRPRESNVLLQRGTARRSLQHQPEPAGFFGSFSEGESTYSYDGKLAHQSSNPEINVLDGWSPQDPNVDMLRSSVEPADWFQESKSGGYKQAWQNIYPAMPDDVPGNREHTGSWSTDANGLWQQAYKTEADNPSSASWFDTDVSQVDGFGRRKSPGIGDPREDLFWKERSVNTTITCAAPGCTAQALLQAPFSSSSELHKDCKLSVRFHPTDFDDQFSGEKISWVQANGRILQGGCHPVQHGCNMTMARPLFTCVDEAPVDILIPTDGKVNITAKIPMVVDECPYNGNLLSGVAVLTCLVTPKPPTAKKLAAIAPRPVPIVGACSGQMPLQCATRGCTARTTVPIVCTNNAKPKSCKLSVIVNQTDYDNLDGTPELIEYIKVEGKQVASNQRPGLNPCMSIWSNSTPYNAAHPNAKLQFPAVSNHSLPANVTTSRSVQVEGKISTFVDECASNGYLFDAMAYVTCLSTQVPAALLSTDAARGSPVSHHS